MLLIRIRESKEPLAGSPPGRIAEVEFREAGGHDMRPSVYRLDDPKDGVRAYCEHYAHNGLGPPGKLGGLLLQGLGGTPTSAPTDAPFQFIRSRHHELEFADDGALLAMIEQLLLRHDERVVTFEKADVQGYLRERLEAEDPEWRIALSRLHESNRDRWAVFAFGEVIKEAETVRKRVQNLPKSAKRAEQLALAEQASKDLTHRRGELKRRVAEWRA